MNTQAITINELVLRRSTPFVINSYNQLTYVRNMVTKLRDAGFRNIYIIDQASTYPPLRAWLAQASEEGLAFPLYSPSNNGPHHFFLSRLYEIFGGAPFLYSDPDLSWDVLAHDFLTRLFSIAHRYGIYKVGPALTLPTPDELKPGMITTADRGIPMTVTEFEQRYWQHEIEPGVYNAPIDTTMHLFLPQYYKAGAPLVTGVRVGGKGYGMTHLPWFVHDPMPADEYQFYLQQTRHTTWKPKDSN
jgi:hypothetical protein